MIRIILAAVTCAALAGMNYYHQQHNTANSVLEIEGPDTRHLATGEGLLTYKLTNPCDQAVFLIGFGAGCGNNCCISVGDVRFPVEIPANSQLELTLPYRVERPVNYELRTAFYYDNGKASRLD